MSSLAVGIAPAPFLFDTQVILILILIDVQYSQKGLNHQNQSSSGSHHAVKNPPQ